VWTRSAKTAAAPTDAYYAVPHFKITSTSSTEDHYFDAIQFELASSATYYQDARQILINLKATRINELLNPNFESTTDYWNVSNGTFLLTTDVEESPGDFVTPISGGAVEVYSSAAGTVTVTSEPMPVFAGNDYTFSVYASSLGESTTYPTTIFINWYNSSSGLISKDESASFNLIPTYARPYITADAPVGAVTADVGISWTANGIDNTIILDCALFEKASYLGSFFDGSTGVANATDLFWEGDVVNGARSHYYRNRFAVQSRLINTIPDWITLGSTFELLLAQPD
jgi:hypothetical protein